MARATPASSAVSSPCHAARVLPTALGPAHGQWRRGRSIGLCVHQRHQRCTHVSTGHRRGVCVVSVRGTIPMMGMRARGRSPNPPASSRTVGFLDRCVCMRTGPSSATSRAMLATPLSNSGFLQSVPHAPGQHGTFVVKNTSGRGTAVPLIAAATFPCTASPVMGCHDGFVWRTSAWFADGAARTPHARNGASEVR